MAVSINVSKIQPLADRIFVKISSSEETTAGGILLPDSAKEKPQMGEVVAVGAGQVNKKGQRIPLDVKIGDKVLYSKYAGTDLKMGGEEYILLTERDILATVE